MRLPLPPYRLCRALALSACAAAVTTPAAHGQTTTPAPAPTTQPATPAQPKNQVLFQGHTPLDVPSTEEVQPAQPQQPAATGVSSSQKRGRTLRRRTVPADSAEPAPATAEQTTAADDLPTTPTMPQVTADDRAASALITDAMRNAVQIISTELDLHLHTHTGDAEARAQLVIRNVGDRPLAVLPLRISGALAWQSVLLRGSGVSQLPLEQHHLRDDLDHTGVANELAIHLPAPLAPGAEAHIDLFYSGSLSDADERLLAVGAPSAVALRTDWDTVGDTFTGVRGLGNVLWYPVAGAPASLRDSDAVPRAVAAARVRDAGAAFRLNLTVEYAAEAPKAAFFCGESAPLKPLTAAPGNGAEITNDAGGVLTATWIRRSLGPHTPSLFLTSATAHPFANGTVLAMTDDDGTATRVGNAAASLRPVMTDWLGAEPAQPLAVLNLPVPDAAAFADGALAVVPIPTERNLTAALVQPLASAYLGDSITAPWLREGIPAFLQEVWAERVDGRTAALSAVRTHYNKLTAQTTPVPAVSSSQAEDPQAKPEAVASCTDTACTRGKAVFVLEMLRSMLGVGGSGDAGLAGAMSGWRISERNNAGTDAAAETASFERLVQQVAGKHDLGWFFRDWIDTAHGLPELSIVTVAPRRVERNFSTTYLPPQKQAYGGPIGAEPVPQPGDPDDVARRQAVTPGDRVAPAAGSWLVAVEVQNNGDAEAEVPVTVRSGNLTNSLPLRIPAHSRSTIRVPFEADPQEVLVNDGSVPETRTSEHRRTIGTLPTQH